MERRVVDYANTELTRAQVDALPGPTLIEFGSATCGWCRAAQPHIRQALATKHSVRHLMIADGPGRPLGRSFGVKLWPTLIFLRDGREHGRSVRPQTVAEIGAGLVQISAP